MTRALPAIPRQNNIGLLRLLFALIVLLAHSYALSLSPALAPLQAITNSELAVQGFFVLSGFLVVMSYEHSLGLRDYIAKRVRRIYPAYATVVLGCAGGGFFLANTADYFNAQWLHYVLANLAFLNFLAPDLPSLFTQNPLSAVNGALWTIKIEVMFYACVPLLAWLLRRPSRPWLMLAIYAASLAYTQYCTRHGLTVLAHQLPAQLCYFIGGVALYYYFEWFMARRRLLVPLALLAYALAVFAPLAFLQPAALAALVIAAAFAPYLGNSERYGDISYGLYIWHFPILQTLVMLGVFSTSPYTSLVASILLSALAALLSWHGVEKRWLRASSHYRAVALTA